MNVYNTEFAKWLEHVGSGPTAKVNKVAQTKPSERVFRGTDWAVRDIISLLRNTAHGVKTVHPRSTGRMFSDVAVTSGNGDPVIKGRGASVDWSGSANDWWYPGGAPPGYPVLGPNDTIVVVEVGDLWG